MPLVAPVARGTPVGRHMDDGYQTLITFSSNATLSVWEKGVKDSGLDGGEPVPTSTMLNVLYHTMAPRVLIKSTPISMKVAYATRSKTQILAMVNVAQQINAWLPDGSAMGYFGYLKSFTPSENKEGEQPEADMEVVITNTDPVTGAEVGPQHYPSGGTGT